MLNIYYIDSLLPLSIRLQTHKMIGVVSAM